MNPVFILIITLILPSGKIDINHTLVPICPEKEKIVTMMEEMVTRKEILGWGGTCTPLIPPKEA